MARQSSAGKSKVKSATAAKVANKQRNKTMRTTFRVEKKARKAADNKKIIVNPFLSAETGVVSSYNPNSKRAKKSAAKALRKIAAAKKEEKMKERNAPVRPEDVMKVLGGKVTAVGAKNNKQPKNVEPEDSGSDSGSDSEAEEETPKAKTKKEKSATPFISSKMAAMLKAQGKDVKEIIQKRQDAIDRKAKAVAEKIARDNRFDLTDSEYLTAKPMSESEASDLEDDDEAFERYANFFQKREEDIKNAVTIEKAKKERSKERMRQRQEMPTAKDSESDSDSGSDDNDEEEEVDDGGFVNDGPSDSDSNDTENVFADISATIDDSNRKIIREEANLRKIQKKKSETEAEDRLRGYEDRLSARAMKVNEEEVAQNKLLPIGISSRVSKKLLVRQEDGTWVTPASADGEDDPIDKPDLSAYVRQPKKKKTKVEIPADELDPRNSKVLKAASNLSKSLDEDVESIAKKAGLNTDEIDEDESEVEIDENDFSDGDVEEETERIKPVSEMTLEEFQAARLNRIQKVQVVIADLCQEILVNPDKFFPAGHAKALVDLCKDQDKTIRQLALVSLTQVIIDVMPDYRIRLPTADELKREMQGGKKVSRDVSKMRKYEKSLLDTYASLIKMLRTSVRSVIANKNHSKRASTAEATNEHGLPMVALSCLCRLFERGYAFNLSKEIATFLAAILTSRYERFRDLVARTVVQVFRLDVAGDATLEIVRAIAQVFKNRGGDKVRAPLLSVLLHLPLSRDVITAEVDTKDKRTQKKKQTTGAGVRHWAQQQQKQQEVKSKIKSKMKRGKLDDESYKKLVGSLNHRQPKEVDERSLSRDIAEGDAEISLAHRKKTQSATLALVFTIYFRYLKEAPTLKSLYSRDTHADTQAITKELARKEAEIEKLKKEAEAKGEEYVQRAQPWTPPMPPVPPSHLLLTAVLKGVCQFSHLINLELVLDLLEHLKQVIGASANGFTFSPSSDAHEVQAAPQASMTSMSNNARFKKRKQFHQDKVDDLTGNAGALPLRSALLCVHTSFSLFKMYSNALTIDLHAFYSHFYEMMWQLVLPHELYHLPLALDCWELMLLSPRVLPPARVAALCRRFLIVAVTMRPNLTLSIVQAVGLALQRHPRAAAILENDGMNSGTYDALVSDPDVSHSLGSPGWDLTLLPTMYHPLSARFVGHAFDIPESIFAWTGTHAEGYNPALNKKRPLDEDARDRSGYGASQISISVGSERVALNLLKPQHVLRILDTSRGAFVPDIPAPPPAAMAISYPDTVTPSLLKQALGRASAARRGALLESFDPMSLLPNAIRPSSITEKHAGSNPSKRRKYETTHTVSSENEWLSQSLGEESFASKLRSTQKAEYLQRLTLLSTFAKIHLARREGAFDDFEQVEEEDDIVEEDEDELCFDSAEDDELMFEEDEATEM